MNPCRNNRKQRADFNLLELLKKGRTFSQDVQRFFYLRWKVASA